MNVENVTLIKVTLECKYTGYKHDTVIISTRIDSNTNSEIK